MYNNDIIHYHLLGNDYEFITLGANSLIICEIAQWAKDKGIKEFHLGGASKESLFKFKKSFTKNGVLDFYVGTKIRNESIYNTLIKLCGVNDKGYFPGYRIKN
jgi:lipid II:glycine glycyltransferase (peptidoglycan interpeptide bridge formation enzyme)